MKKSVFITTLLLSLTLTGTASAATTTAPTANISQIETKQINQLKDKIASRVSQLNLVEKRGVIGTIQDVNSSQITLTTYEGNVQYVDVDEITKFSSTGAGASFGISDLKKGMLIRVLGIYNKESQRILARYVDTETVPTRYSGEIVSIDKTNYQFTLMTNTSKSRNIDIETTSEISSYTPAAGTATYGFSKLAVGDRVIVVGFPDKKNASLLIADRVIDFLNGPKDPNIALVTPTIVPTIAPASKGAKNINPIK